MKCWVWILCLIVSFHSFGQRLKDLASIRGERDNELLGYGVVVGLGGTGDKDLEMTGTSLSLVLKGLGVDLKSKEMSTKNAAAVIVSATLRPFTQVGSRLDVTLSSIGTASSLQGGTLLMTPLKGADGKVYAIAQGKITPKIAADGNAGGGGNNKGGVTETILGGALLESRIDFDISKLQEIRYLLHHPDFTTSARAARRINEELGARYATAVDAGTIDVIFPLGFEGNLVDLLAQIENVDVESDSKAKVVINQASGTVVLGEHVSVSPVAIAHNNLRIEIEKPAPKPTPGQRAVSSQPEKVEQALMVSEGGAKVSDVVAGLNAMGATPKDLIAILQALRTSGALIAELEIQ